MIQEEKKINDGSVRWRIKNLGNSLINHRVYNPSMKDFNDYINEGFYAIRGVNTNPPTSGNYYGNLIVLNTDYDRNGTNTYIKQILLTHDKTFIRSCHGTTWGSWKEIIDKLNIIEAQSTSTNGYLKFGPAFNNLIIQYGHIYNTIDLRDNKNCKFDFPISFSKRRYLHLTGTQRIVIPYEDIVEDTKIQFALKIWMANCGTGIITTDRVNDIGHIYWFAIGY